jgi:uncharacterized protein (TIGR02145 family)
MKKLGVLLILTVASFILLITCKKDDDEKKLPVITTNEVTDITHNSATSGGVITDDGASTIITRGVCWSTVQNPTINDNKTYDGTGSGGFLSEIKDLEPETTYYVRAYATNANGTGYGSALSFTTNAKLVFGLPCPGTPTVTDIDGNVYNTVLIGDQCWMKENLKTTRYNNGTPVANVTDETAWSALTTGAYVWYNNDISWKDSYGALYNWHAVSNASGLCPQGWHVPYDDDWAQLIDYVTALGFPNEDNNPDGVANALKSCWQINSPLGGACNTTVHPRWEEDTWTGYNHYGFNQFGFSGLPGGLRYAYGEFTFIGYSGIWWSSTVHVTDYSWSRFMGCFDSNVISIGSSMQDGFSVRCIKE